MASLYLRGKTYWISYYPTPGVKPVQLSLKTRDKTVAKFKKNEIENRLTTGDIPRFNKNILLLDAYENFKKETQSSIKTATRIYYQDILKPFLASLSADIKLAAINNDLVTKYVNERIATRNIQPGMVWHILKVLKTFFNFCVHQKYLTENPVKKKKPKLPKKAPECWTTPEIKRVLLFTQGTLEGNIIEFNLYVGLRPSELIRLKWRDIDLDRETLTVQEAKDDEFRMIALHPAATKVLRNLPRVNDHVFPGITVRSLERKARAIKKKADLKRIKKFWYSTRHTFGTTYYEKTRDLRGLQEILGHSKIEMTTIYVNPNEAHRLKTLRQLKYEI